MNNSSNHTDVNSNSNFIVKKTNIYWIYSNKAIHLHYNDVVMSLMASQITSLATVYSTVYSGVDQKEHQSSASLAFVGGIHRSPVNSPHKGPVTRKMFPFDDIIMVSLFVSKSTPRYFSGLAKPALKFSHWLLISPLSFMWMQPPMP